MLPTLLYLVTEDWYFASHRLVLARAALSEGFRVVVASRFADHEDAIRQCGCETIRLSWKRSRNSARAHVAALLEITAIYRRVRPDIVHHVALKPVVYGSLAARVARVPRVVNAIAGLGHVFTANDRNSRALRTALKIALWALLDSEKSRVIVQNPEDCDLLLSAALARATHVSLIRGVGVDLNVFRPRSRHAPVPTVVLASRMLWSKGVGDFVEAARWLRNRGIRARFVLVGRPDADNAASIDGAQLANWAKEGVVEVWGHRADMPAVLGSADIFCLPSAYGEGVPKVLLEAIASGLPVVTTNTPGCREVVRDGINGLLVPARSVESLREALARLIADEALRTRMGAAGRRRAEAEFSDRAVVDATLAIYRELLAC